jgi:hypothetical protein
MPYTKKITSSLEKIVYDLLLEKGFPPESIIYDPSMYSSGTGIVYTPDFLIVDPLTKEFLAIIEVKSKQVDLSHARNLLERYKKSLGATRAATFVVTGSEDVPEKIAIFKSSSQNVTDEVETNLLPNFQALQVNNVAGKKTEIKTDQDKTIRNLRATGVFLSIFLFAVTVSDFILSLRNIQLLNTERITLLGAVIILLLIPFFQKFKGLGLEWELATRDKEKDATKDNKKKN